MTQDDDDSAIRESRKFAGEVLREIAATTQLHVATSAGPVPMSEMVNSQQLMANLLKMALFCGNMHQFADFASDGKKWRGVPVSLMGIFLKYVLEATPVDDDGNIDQNQLSKMIFDIETVSGIIPVDPLLIAEISRPDPQQKPRSGMSPLSTWGSGNTEDDDG